MLALLTTLFVSTASISVPGDIMHDVEYAGEICRAMGSNFSYDNRYIETIDLNNDGTPDYIVDGRGLNCGMMTKSLYGGAQGLPLYVYISTNAGEWEKVMNTHAFEYRVKQQYGKQPFFDVWVRGDAGYAKNFMRHQWDGEKLAVIETEYGAEIPRDLWKNLD